MLTSETRGSAGKKSICKNRKSSILGADIRNIDAPGAEINKLAAVSQEEEANKNMRILILIFLLPFSVSTLFGQNITNKSGKSFPTNIQIGSIKELKKFDGKVIAYDGIIERIENSRNNTPFYKLKISTNNYLWTVLMFNNQANKVGDTVRIVGYLIPSEPNESEKQYLDTKYMVIAFGLIDFENSNLLMMEGKQKQEWKDGRIPSSK